MRFQASQLRGAGGFQELPLGGGFQERLPGHEAEDAGWIFV